MKKPIITFTLASLLSLSSFAQLIRHERLLSFEQTEISPFISVVNSSINISSEHYKDGAHSLLWSFEPSGELLINKPLGFEKKDPTGVDTYYSTFIVWVYNETPMDDTITFQFLKDGKLCTSFPFGINYSGWRAAWVCYERDMQGTPEEGMNQIRVIAPHTGGKLYIDHLLTAAKTDRRYQTPDVQAPFVNANTNNHWLVLLKRSQLKPDIATEPTISPSQKNDIRLIEERFKELIYTPAQLSDNELSNIRKAYYNYGIKKINGKISGLPIFYIRAAEAYERILPNWKGDMIETSGQGVKQYFDLMNRIAVAYNNASNSEQKDELATLFMNMYYHIHDQGFAYGSGLGNITHYGYSFRSFYTSYYLMKEVFQKAGKLEEAEKAMQWYAMTNEVFIRPEMPGMDIDAFNTVTTGRIASILMMEDTPGKVQYMKSFSRWINNGCLPAPGLAGSFKTDGAAFHHCNNYPAYAVGGLGGATNMIYLLNRTCFAVSEPAHATVKNVLLTMRFYCNKVYFPLSMSGRHPDGKGQLAPAQYATMALAGTPDQSHAIDKEMAAAYLRLIAESGETDIPEYVPQSINKLDKKRIDYFLSQGIQPEGDPQGNIALGYGCVSVQRRDNWSAVARGYSRYLWAAEHYRGANLYGRYLAHGSLQIMKSANGETVTPATSGWQQEGFDWARIPGTTAIHLPIDEMKAIVLNVDTCSGFEEMLYSDEAFAGGLSQQGQNGSFGMKLHEHDKYNGSLRARKSYHFFDNKIICLGTDIENINTDYTTETTVFQLAVPDNQAREYWENHPSDRNYWLDPIHTGYYIPNRKNPHLRFEKNVPQHSRRQNNGEPTEGNWVSLTLDHGKAPKGGTYEYVILPHTNENELQQFVRKPAYHVLQQNRNAHIVKDSKTGITSYVVFETLRQSADKYIQAVDTACLIMLKDEKKSALLTVCNPDLALYRGPSDEALDENGKRIERSIYSRPWIGNESKEIPVTITLKGEWKMRETDHCKVLFYGRKQTVIQVICKDGASYNMEIHKL